MGAPASVPAKLAWASKVVKTALTTISHSANRHSMGATDSNASIAICRFFVFPDREAEFEDLLARHYPTLAELGLVEAQPHLALRGRTSDGRVFYVEILPWKDAGAVARAHEHPAVAAIWERMEGLCESMEFPHAEKLDL
jgi:quinol monooxygenase YgiN